MASHARAAVGKNPLGRSACFTRVDATTSSFSNVMQQPIRQAYFSQLSEGLDLAVVLIKKILHFCGVKNPNIQVKDRQ